MEKEKLKVIVSKPCAFAGLDFEDQKEVINNAIKEGHTPVTAQYLHGDVEDKMGYDIGLFLNGEVCADIDKGEYKVGIYDTEVIGYDNPCKAYLWGTKGLIVDINDKESVEYAESKYKERSNNL